MSHPLHSAPVARPLDAEETAAVVAWLAWRAGWLRVRRVVWLPVLTAAFAGTLVGRANSGVCAVFLLPLLMWAWISALGIAPGAPRVTVWLKRDLQTVTGTLRSDRRQVAAEGPAGRTVATPSYWPPIDGEVEALVFVPLQLQGDRLHSALKSPLVLQAKRVSNPHRVWSVGEDVRAGRIRAADVTFRLDG